MIKRYNFVSYQSSSVTPVLLVVGMTFHKFAGKTKNQSCIQQLDLDYIFVDEASMLSEVFDKILLMIKKLKKLNSNFQIIISGEYNQLEPVNKKYHPIQIVLIPLACLNL